MKQFIPQYERAFRLKMSLVSSIECPESPIFFFSSLLEFRFLKTYNSLKVVLKMREMGKITDLKGSTGKES